ncbi:MAG: DUF2752 domain-containing protein [Planctomycetota bacterium]
MPVTGSKKNGADPPRGLRAAWFWLTGSALAITAGISADVAPESATWFGVRGPQCPLGSCLGQLHCPGCGLVRSTSSALQGDLEAAWHFHPAGIVIAALLPVTFLVHFDILRRRRELPLHHRLRRAGYLLFVASILTGWALRYFIRS